MLLEETPTFDTVEARQRARIIVGALSVFCVFLLVWITYSVFLGNAGEIEQSAELPSSPPPIPHVSLPLDDQARYLFNRARELAKAGRADDAINTLKRVVAVYKGTQTAVEARMALERPSRNLPLFPDGPAVLAEQKPAAPSVQATAPGSGAPRPGPTRVATGPVPMFGPEALIPVQRPGQPSQPQPASPRSMQPQSNQPPPAQPQAVQPQPGPGQVVLVPPANPAAAPEMPAAVARADAGNADVAPQGLPRRVLPHGFEAKPEEGYHESGWPLVIAGKRDGGKMVLVPGGTFIMGSDRGESAEAPAHTVRMSTFYIDQYEVTNRQFRIFLDDSHYHGRPPGKWLTDEKLRDAPRVLRRRSTSITTMPSSSPSGPASGCRPRRSGRWRLARAMAAAIPGAISRSNGRGPGSFTRSIRS